MYLEGNDGLYVRFDRVEKMCMRKKSYPKRKTARKRIRELIKGDGKQRYVYKCPICQNYHITTHAPEEYFYVKARVANRGRKEKGSTSTKKM